jgi:hypothetical protein
LFTYFVAYQVSSVPSRIGNTWVSQEEEIDSYQKVGEVEQAIAANLRSQGIVGQVVVTNWIPLRA